jgi:hypothetical protein
MDYLKPYDRATVGLWLRNHTQVTNEVGCNVMVGAATHAVLTGLRRHLNPTSLLAAYGSDAAADLALIGSLLPDALAVSRPEFPGGLCYWELASKGVAGW